MIDSRVEWHAKIGRIFPRLYVICIEDKLSVVWLDISISDRITYVWEFVPRWVLLACYGALEGYAGILKLFIEFANLLSILGGLDIKVMNCN